MTPYEPCQPFVEHLRGEHARLNAELRAVQEALAEFISAPRNTADAGAVAARLVRLRDELDRHYAEEEAGGCLEEAVSRCPSLGADVQRLVKEHPVLRRQMDELVAKAQRLSQTPQQFDEVARDFAALTAWLHRHESEENRILLYGFGAQGMDEFTEDPNQVT
jgi:hemerythrin-like domain-containing protein